MLQSNDKSWTVVMTVSSVGKSQAARDTEAYNLRDALPALREGRVQYSKDYQRF